MKTLRTIIMRIGRLDMLAKIKVPMVQTMYERPPIDKYQCMVTRKYMLRSRTS